MARREDSLHLGLEIDVKQAIAELQAAMLETKRTFEARPIEVDFNIAYQKIDKLLGLFSQLLAKKGQLEKQDFGGEQGEKLKKQLEAILGLIPRVSKELQSVGSAVEGMSVKTARLTDNFKTTGSKAMHEDAKKLLSVYDDIQKKLQSIRHTQSMGNTVSGRSMTGLENSIKEFEKLHQQMTGFARGGKKTGFADLPYEISKSFTDALGKTKNGLTQFTQQFDRVLNVESSRSFDKFEKMVDEKVKRIKNTLGNRLATIQTDYRNNMMINASEYNLGMGNFRNSERWFNDRIADLTGTDAETVRRRRYLEEQRDAVGLSASNFVSQYHDIKNRKGIALGVLPDPTMSTVLDRGQTYLALARRMMNSQGSRVASYIDSGYGVGEAIGKVDVRNQNVLYKLRAYVEAAKQQLVDIENNKMPSNPKVVSELRKYVKNTTKEIRELETEAAASTASRQKLQGIVQGNILPSGGGLSGFLKSKFVGAKAFAGSSDEELASTGRFLVDMLHGGDLSEVERGQAQRALNALNMRQRMVNRLGEKGRIFSNPLMLGMGFPLLFGKNVGFDALHPEIGGYGGMFGRGGGAYGRGYDSFFNRANALTSHTSALMGFPLYGMGMFGAGVAAIGGSSKLAAEAEMQKLALSGMFNTFMGFNRAASPVQNLMMSREYSQDMYKQLRQTARGSVLTTSELFQYYMTAAGPGLGRGINPKQLIGIVSQMASLGKLMGLQERDVLQDIRATLSGDIRQSNKIGTILGFTNKNVKEAYAKGPEGFVDLFNQKMEGYGQASKLIPDTFQGSMNKLLDALQQTGRAFGDKLNEKIAGPIKSLADTLLKLADDGILDRAASSIGSILRSVIGALENFAKNADNIFANMGNIFTSFAGILGSAVLFKMNIALTSILLNLDQFNGGLKSKQIAMGSVLMGIASAIAMFIATMVTLKDQAEREALGKSQELGDLTTSKYKDMSEADRNSVLKVMADQYFGTGGPQTVRIFGKDVSYKEMQKMISMVSPEVMQNYQSYSSGGPEAWSDWLLNLGSGPLDWYKKQHPGSSDAEAKKALAQLYAQGKTPWRDQEGIVPDLQGAINLDKDFQVQAYLLDEIQKALGNVPSGKGAGIAAGTNVQARNGAYARVFAEAGLSVPADVKSGKMSYTAYVKTLKGDDLVKFQKALRAYSTGGDRFAYTPQNTVSVDDTSKKSGAPSLGVSETTYAGVLGKNAELAFARLSHLVDSTPDLAMSGGRFLKPELLGQQFTLGMQAARTQFDTVVAKGGNANDIKIAAIEFQKTIEDLRAKYELNVRAVQENVEIQKQQTEVLRRNVALMQADIALRQQQSRLGFIQPTTGGNLNAFLGGLIQMGGMKDVATAMQYAGSLSDIGMADRINSIKYGAFSGSYGGFGSVTSTGSLGVLNKARIATSITTAEGRRGSGVGAAEDTMSDMLRSLGNAVKTPKGEASCAYFASMVLKGAGAKIDVMGNARDLSRIGTPIAESDAVAGDLVTWKGKGYGKIKYEGGVGYHSGVYLGNGRVLTSSGGRKREVNMYDSKNATFSRILGDYKINPGNRLSSNFVDSNAVLTTLLAQSLGIPLGPDGSFDIAGFNTQQELKRKQAMLQMYGSQVDNWMSIGQQAYGAFSQYRLGGLSLNPLSPNIPNLEMGMQAQLSLMGLRGADRGFQRQLSAASASVAFGKAQYDAGLAQHQAGYGQKLAQLSAVMPIAGAFGFNTKGMMEKFVSDQNKEFGNVALRLYNQFVRVPMLLERQIQVSIDRQRRLNAVDDQYKLALIGQGSASFDRRMQLGYEGISNIGNLGYFSPSSMSQRGMDQQLFDINQQVERESLQYRRIAMGFFPGADDAQIEQMVAGWSARRRESLIGPVFNKYGGSYLGNMGRNAKVSTVGNLVQNLIANPMQLASLGGLAQLAVSSGSPLADMFNQQNNAFMNVLLNGNSETMKSFMATYGAKYGIKTSRQARNLAGKVVGANIAGSFLGNWLGTQIGGDPESVNMGSTIGGMLGSFIPALGPFGGAVGMLAGGLLGGLFGRRREVDPREEQYRKRIEELLSSIDKQLRPQNDYFRTVNRDVLFGSASRFLSGRYNNGVTNQRV